MTDKNAKILSEEEAFNQDGLENLIAELGTEQDKRHQSRFVNNKMLSAKGNQDELNALYRTDWLGGKVVDIIPNDMTREWRRFTGDLDPKIIKILEKEEKRLRLKHMFNEAHKWARLYGTSFIIMAVDDGQLPEKPLNIDKIKKSGLRHLKIIDKHRIDSADVTPILDPFDPAFGFPKFYRLSETSIKIHHSRVLRFDGVKLPFEEFRRNNYFSDSVLDRLYDALTNMSTVSNSAASMVYETNVDIVKVKGFMNYLQTAEGEKILRKRFALAGMLKSFNNMFILDSDEEWSNKTNSFAGLPDLIDRYGHIITAASDVPATRLLGSSASGMNATGEGDLKNYYDKIRSDQNNDYAPLLDYFDQIMAKSLGVDADSMEYEFNSLFQLSPKEQADTRFIDAQRHAIYLDRDIITPAIVAKELKQDTVYTNIDDKYILELEDLEDLDANLDDDDDTEDNDDDDTDANSVQSEKEKDEEGEGNKTGEES